MADKFNNSCIHNSTYSSITW